MASSYQAPVSAVQVGSYFVGQYYQVLKEHPDLAHQFYSESSSMIRIEGEDSETASTMLEIHGFLTSLHLTTIEVKTINSLESWDGGILVVVSGLVKTKEFSGKRKFIQTFFLAPQEKGFFVLNDIFQFSDDGNVYQHQHAPTVMTDDKSKMQFNTSSPTPEPVSNYSLGEEAGEYIRSVNLEENPVNQYGQDNQVDEYYGQDNQVDEYYGQDNQVNEYSHDDLVNDLNAYGLAEHQYREEPHEPVLENSYEENVSIPTQTVQAMPSAQDAPNEPLEEPSKKTYASILQIARAHAQLASAVPSQPSVNKASPVTSDWSYTPQPTPQQTNVKPSFEPEPVAEAAEDSFFDDEGLLKSVYVRNLPSDVTEAEIADVFKHFGKIIPDGVAIKLRKEIGICYAFVEFEDFLGVHNAVKASPVQLAGRSIYVEERRANTTGGSRGGRRGGRGGRGGYPTETGRGRFGSQSGRGSSNYDSSSDYSRPRGNNGSYARGTR